MQVTALFFAHWADRMGGRSRVYDLPDGATVADLLGAITAGDPRMETLGRSVRVAINEEFAKTNSPLHDGDEAAFLPPVSGG